MPGRIARNSVIDTGSQLGALVFSVLAGIILARALGDEGRGMYVLATGFAGYLLLSFTSFGVELSASTLAARHSARFAQLHTLVAMLALSAGLLLAGFVYTLPAFFTSVLFPGLEMRALWLATTAIPFWVYLYGVYGLLIGRGRVRSRAAFDLVFQFLQNAAVIVLVLLLAGGELMRATWAVIVSYYALIIVSGSASFLLLRREERTLWAVPDRSFAWDFLRYGLTVHSGNLAAALGQRIDQYFVQKVSGDIASFGVYTLAAGLAYRARIFPQALSRSTYGTISSAPPDEAARLVAACFRQMLVIGIVIFALGAIASPLIPLVYTSAFAPAVVPFVILLFGRMIHNAGWMLPAWFTGQLAAPRVPTIVNWTLLPVQGVAAWWAMKQGGLIAVAAAAAFFSILQTGVFLVLFLRSQRHAGLRDLFLVGREDLAPWLRLFRRAVRHRERE